MESTGERLVPTEKHDRNYDDHVSRYKFACQFVKDKAVLDIACGTGYGTEYLSDAGAKVVEGVDVDADTIAFARHYYASDTVHFTCASADAIPFSKNYFDVIVSFETIEHLENSTRRNYLSQMSDVLKDGGIIILSTPNKKITSPYRKKPNNPFHVMEFTRSYLRREITAAGFDIKEWYGQRHVNVFFTLFSVRKSIRLIERLFKRDFHIFDIADGPNVQKLTPFIEPRYFVVILEKKT